MTRQALDDIFVNKGNQRENRSILLSTWLYYIDHSINGRKINLNVKGSTFLAVNLIKFLRAERKIIHSRKQTREDFQIKSPYQLANILKILAMSQTAESKQKRRGRWTCEGEIPLQVL